MRDIIFRGKRKDNGDWVEGWLLGNPDSAGGVFIVTYYQYILDLKGERYIVAPKTMEEFEVIPKTVGMFTNRLDKNGVRIFEGDIDSDSRELRYGDYGINVDTRDSSYQEMKYGWYWFDKSEQPDYQCTEFIPEAGIEIIGNIHDKKEGE
jgi:uncharacterized phage protein (TIGR01671 family)